MVRRGLTARQGQAGFTLLEMMVALVVLGFLMVGLVQGQRFGFVAWKHQADAIADHDQLDAVDRTLRQLLTQVELRGAGTRGELNFTGTLPMAVATGTRRADMKLSVDPDHQLVLEWTPRAHETSLVPPQTPTTTILMRRVQRLDIAYFAGGDPSSTDAVAWSDQSNATEVPKLLKLTLTFMPGDRRHWPPIVVSPATVGPDMPAPQ
jgi:general secretion pathway protein J